MWVAVISAAVSAAWRQSQASLATSARKGDARTWRICRIPRSSRNGGNGTDTHPVAMPSPKGGFLRRILGNQGILGRADPSLPRLGQAGMEELTDPLSCPRNERVKKLFVPGTSRIRTGIGPRFFREHLRCVGDFFTRSKAGIQSGNTHLTRVCAKPLDPRFRGDDGAGSRGRGVRRAKLAPRLRAVAPPADSSYP